MFDRARRWSWSKVSFAMAPVGRRRFDRSTVHCVLRPGMKPVEREREEDEDGQEGETQRRCMRRGERILTITSVPRVTE